MYIIQEKKQVNILIKIFRLLPLSIHANIYNLSIVNKIIESQNIITATKLPTDKILLAMESKTLESLKVFKTFFRYIIQTM